MFVNKLFTYLTCAYLKKKRCLNVKSSRYYVHVKTMILADLQICISVTLRLSSESVKKDVSFTLKGLSLIFAVFITFRNLINF